MEFNAFPGVVAFSVSENGVLAYGVGSGTPEIQMTWLDRQGKPLSTVGPEGNYQGIDVSPDGMRVVAHRPDGQGGDLWLFDLSRGTTSRLTFDSSQNNASPIWFPDGNRIVFKSFRGGKFGLYQKRANGAGGEELLIESETTIVPTSWSSDGRSLIYQITDPKTGNDLLALPMPSRAALRREPADGSKPVALLRTPFSEMHGQISPDGAWLAYSSNETGRYEVYVQRFPSSVGKWQVSANGGSYPRWRGDGRELFYLDKGFDGKLVAVEVKTTPSTFEAGRIRELFDSGYYNALHGAFGPYHAYAVSADGQRFLIPRPLSTGSKATAPAPIAIVLNWDTGLRK